MIEIPKEWALMKIWVIESSLPNISDKVSFSHCSYYSPLMIFKFLDIKEPHLLKIHIFKRK